MPRLTAEDLKKIKDKTRRSMLLREGAGRAKITVHMGTCGIAAGARDIWNTLLAIVREADSEGIIVTTSGCAGLCSREPMATIELKGEAPVKYGDLTEAKINKIFSEHVLDGQIVTKYAISRGSERTH